MVSDDDFKEVSKIEFAAYIRTHVLVPSKGSSLGGVRRQKYEDADKKHVAEQVTQNGVSTYKILKD